MAGTIQAAFSQFIADLRTTKQESSIAASHRTSIKSKLETEFGLTTLFRTGSFGNGTNVSGCSDVDYFAVIPTANLKQDSQTTLADVAVALRARFPTTANIRVNSPGVQIPFGLDGAEHTEIIPVDHTGMTQLGFRQFDIPDGNGGWMFSAPESHNAFVRHHDERLGGNLKPLIRCLKAWKFYRNVPIKSFYLEMLVTACMTDETVIVHSIDIRNVLQRLVQLEAVPIIDPRFPAMAVSACATELQRQEIVAKATTAANWAAQAREAEDSGQLYDAFERWNLVFNYTFPPCTL